MIVATVLFLFSRYRVTAGLIAVGAGLLAFSGAIFNLLHAYWTGEDPSACFMVELRAYGLWVLLAFSILMLIVGLVILLLWSSRTVDEVNPKE